MQQNSHGRIFVYDDNKAMLPIFRDIFNNRSIDMFGTDNVFKLLQYAKEINPNVLVFDIQDNYTPAVATIEHFGAEINWDMYPIIVLKPIQYDFNLYDGVAHYLHTPLDLGRFIDIIESYCVGNKTHDIMLLGKYCEEKSRFRQQLDDYGYTYFEVHDERAARIYLKKNKPQIVCIEYALPFVSAHHNLFHDKIFYVDREQDITEIKKFIH